MNYQKVSNETKGRLEAYLRPRGLSLQGRGNMKGTWKRNRVVTFDKALDIILKEAGF